MGEEWVPEWPEDLPSSLDPAQLERLAWDVGLESLLPTRSFLYVDGVACRALLRPVGWPPWEATDSSASGDDMLVAWGASPLGHPRLDDPLLVIRERSEDKDGQWFEIGLQVVETVDLLEAARELEPSVVGLGPWLLSLDHTVLETKSDGHGLLRWSTAHDQPSEVSLEIDVELVLEIELGLGYWGSQAIQVEVAGCLRQRMTWDPILSRRRSPPARRTD